MLLGKQDVIIIADENRKQLSIQGRMALKDSL